VPLSAQMVRLDTADAGEAMVMPLPRTVSVAIRPTTLLAVIFISCSFSCVFDFNRF